MRAPVTLRYAGTVSCGLALLVATLVGGCRTTRAPGGQAAQEGGEHVRLMVTLPATAELVVRRSIRDLMAAYELQFVAAWQMRALDQQCVVFEVSSAGERDRVLKSLAVDHRVDLAQPVRRFAVQGERLRKDERKDERSYRRFQKAADQLRLDEAHELATGRGVRLAVVDTGADISHPELGNRVVAAHNFVERGEGSFTSDLHGTAVAGVIAADHTDEVGIIGVAPGVELQVLKACWPEPAGGRAAVCDSYTLALALDTAVTEQVEIINLSLGGREEPILRRLLEVALERRIVLVAAWPPAGPDFPASMEGVLAVRGLSAESETLAPSGAGGGSTGGALAAPSEEILTTSPGGGYDFWSGSSMASAQVAGVVALILEHERDMTPEQVADLLHETARENPEHGVVDACAAVAHVLGTDCP